MDYTSMCMSRMQTTIAWGPPVGRIASDKPWSQGLDGIHWEHWKLASENYGWRLRKQTKCTRRFLCETMSSSLRSQSPWSASQYNPVLLKLPSATSIHDLDVLVPGEASLLSHTHTHTHAAKTPRHYQQQDATISFQCNTTATFFGFLYVAFVTTLHLQTWIMIDLSLIG